MIDLVLRCTACPEEAESEILTSSGVIPVCGNCREMVWSIETNRVEEWECMA